MKKKGGNSIRKNDVSNKNVKNNVDRTLQMLKHYGFWKMPKTSVYRVVFLFNLFTILCAHLSQSMRDEHNIGARYKSALLSLCVYVNAICHAKCFRIFFPLWQLVLVYATSFGIVIDAIFSFFLLTSCVQ